MSITASKTSPAANSRAWAAKQTAETRRKLVLAAIRLMAAEGIDGVSTRSICSAAGTANFSAVQYHFGGKLGLVEAMVGALAEEVFSVRSPLVDDLRRRVSKQTVSLREIVEANYLPVMGLIFHPEYGLPSIKFLSRLIVDTSDEIRSLANQFTGPIAQEMFDLLSVALPDVPAPALKLRILFSLTNLINGMSDLNSLESSPFGDVSTPNSLVAADQFLEYIVAGLSAGGGATVDAELDERFVAKARTLISQIQNRSADSIGATVAND